MDLMQIKPDNVEAVAGFLKGLANPSRLLILCALSQGEKNVTELIAAIGLPPTSMSQHLSKLKTEGIVDFRREHRAFTRLGSACSASLSSAVSRATTA